jgi:hypothetical protein
MVHGDGPGCLAELDALARFDAKLEARFAMIRGQCEMLAGRCQEGKKRVADYYVTETAFSRELAERSAESLAGMRCRGGDSTPRDELLRALWELQDGAYMSPKAPEGCRASLEAARRLLPQVTPREHDDAQLTGGAQALFFMAAQCFAKAGDCQSAWLAYRDLFPAKNLESIADPKLREQTVRRAFDASVERCKGVEGR